MIEIPFGPAFSKFIYNTMECECIRSLLQFADTFTTADYEDRRDAWIADVSGFTREDVGMARSSWASIRHQIQSVGVVVEVDRDVWAKRR